MGKVLIVGIIVIGFLVAVGLIMYFGIRAERGGDNPRKRDVKRAKEEARRARITLNEVKKILLAENESSLDLVGLDLRRRSLNVITEYENQELERNPE